jgi:hypothetical protein
LDPSKVRAFTYRPLDFRYVYDDPAWVDWYREDLHAVMAGGSVPSLVTIPHDHGRGPAVIYVTRLMDQHVFNNRGGNGVYHLWRRDRATGGESSTGFAPGVLTWLTNLGREGLLEQAFNYILAVLSASGYTNRFWRPLEVRLPRVPLTSNAQTFDELAELGAKCRSAWSATRSSKPGISWQGLSSDRVLGKARWDEGIITFECGRRLEGVAEPVWQYEVSGYPVIPRWFRARSHWEPSREALVEALRTVIAVSDLVDLEPELNRALELLLEEAETSEHTRN